jgi:hypothetical protein
MDYYKNQNCRSILLVLIFFSITLGWLFPTISLGCEKERHSIPFGNKSNNQEESWCWTFINSYHCPCCTIKKKQLNVNSTNVAGCQCLVQSNGLSELKIAVSEIVDKRFFKKLLNNTNYAFILPRITNSYFPISYNKYFFKTEDPISLNLFYCHLNIKIRL